MSAHTIHIRSESPDLLIEFELPPGTHGRIGASPQSEITLPLGGIPPFSCILGRFHDGRLYLADLDGAISRRFDLPGILSLPPYDFEVLQPYEAAENPMNLEPLVEQKQPSRPPSLASRFLTGLGLKKTPADSDLATDPDGEAKT